MIPRLLCRWAMLPILLAVLGRALGQGVAPGAELRGDWIGAIRLPNETVTIFLHVRVDGERTRATLDVPDVRAIEFERVVLEAPSFRLLDSKTLPLGVEGRLEEGRLQGRCDLAGGLAGEFALVPIESGPSDERYEELYRRGFLGPLGMIFVARGHAARGEVERAFTWLVRARERQLNVKALFQAPEFEALRGDPRWREVCRDSTAAFPERSPLTHRFRAEAVRVSMRDGVELAADLLVPEPPGKRATILVRTPYSRGSELGEYAHFAARGYVLVVQSVRGRAESGGEFVPWLAERQDGFDTLDWIQGQPWSNGRVGMIGGSYLGQAQWAAAAGAHPALRCIVPIVSGTDHFFDVPYDHGILKLGMLAWGWSMDRRDPRSLPSGVPARAWTTLPLAKLDEAVAGGRSTIWQRWLEADSPGAWSAANFLGDVGRITVPALHVSGWWDGELGGTARNWAAMRAAGRTNQWLVLGPWPHDVNRSSRFADLDYGPDAILDLRSLQVRWFDHWLAERPVGLEKVPRVQVFETGANEWRALEGWPDPRGEELVLHLDSARPLFGLEEAGRLVPGTATSGAGGYVYDPAAVRPEGRADLWTTTRVPLDREREDALFYASDPLDSALELGGPGELDLWFSTSGRDTDFFVLVLDVEPSGTARALTAPSRMRMRYLAGWDAPALLEPGRPHRARIELLPFAHRFDAGHRIGLFLCSEWFPEFDRNLNTGERIRDATRIVVAEQQVFHGGDRPSSVRFRRLPPR